MVLAANDSRRNSFWENLIFQVLIRILSRLCVLIEIMSFNNGLAVVFLEGWGKHLLLCMCGGQGVP